LLAENESVERETAEGVGFVRLLFAEDDRDLSAAVKTLLERNGYLVDAVYDGEEAVSYAEAENYDGMILDWMMPVKDGIQALQEIRKGGCNTPCMMLTARDAVEDRVTGLDAGADDYLPKPFDAGELLARVRAMLRRRESYVPDTLQWEDLVLDKGSCELRCGGKTVRLTGKMYQLTELFMENPRILFSVQQLMDKVWGWDAEAEINVVWVNISQLRKKLAELDTVTEIRVHRGTGYSLEKKAEAGAKK
jgi:DNA-binding response OmpR family regulator